MGLSLYQLRQQAVKQTELSTQNLAHSLESSIAGTFAKINVGVVAMVEETQRQLDGGGINGKGLNDFTARLATHYPELEGIRIADVDGNVRYGTGLPQDGLVNIADVDIFQRLAKETDGALVMSKPEIGRIIGKWRILLARRVTRADGSFAGMAYGVLSLEHFTKLFSAIGLGKYGVISLRELDLSIIVRYPELGKPGSTIGNKSVSVETQEFFKAHPDSGTLEVTTLLDHVQRTISYQRISTYPLYIIVSQANVDYLDLWQKEAVAALFLVVLFTLAIVFSARMIYKQRALELREIAERRQAVELLEKSEERWKFAVEGSGDGLWDWNVQTGQAFYSPRYKSMLGFAEDEIGNGQDEWTKRIHPDDAPGAFASMQRYVDGKAGSGTIEYRMLCKDGSWQWTMGRGMVVERNAQGKALRLIGTISDITERKRHQSQLEHVAHFDALTSLPNRVLLSDRLKQAMAQAQRRNQRLAVVYLDLDGFKTINDQHGHDIGDQVLITLAQRLKQVLREGDSLARLGGDEFVAVLIDLKDLAASRPMLTRMLEACAQPVRVGDLSLQVSASLGVTAYPQEQDIDADQLLRQADQAMYQAKLAGKNRYHIFDATLDSSIRGHHENVERIRLALENHEFVLHYQPKVNMGSGQIIGAEALIRWQHPEKGLLSPAIFLPVIEDHALAVSIGEWVIDTALTQIELWQAAGLDMKVSVNIGARQLQQSDFVDRLKFTLAKHPQVEPASLELEVLETSALKDIAQVSQVIEACAQIGVNFALDDFGTGYSSLTYLKLLRVATLKIDQSFVRDMLEDPDDLAILQGIIGLAAAFKREVIAEGVETIEHGSLLLQLGCELAQGYGIARPMPAEQMPQWATKWQPDAAWDSVWSRIKAGKGLNGIEQTNEAE
ncbi:MAG: EAL domain-containing protein [Comamonadaceae bacterium]